MKSKDKLTGKTVIYLYSFFYFCIPKAERRDNPAEPKGACCCTASRSADCQRAPRSRIKAGLLLYPGCLIFFRKEKERPGKKKRYGTATGSAPERNKAEVSITHHHENRYE